MEEINFYRNKIQNLLKQKLSLEDQLKFIEQEIWKAQGILEYLLTQNKNKNKTTEVKKNE